MNPENGKKTYESIDIPKNLNETVMQTIASKKKEEHENEIRKQENKKASRKQRNPYALSGEAVLRRQQPFWSQAPSAEHKPRFCGKHEQGSRCGAAGAGADLPFL